jgi:hypothetical protein
MRISPYCSADRYELGHVEPPFAKLELRHERLPNTEAFTKLDLGDAGLLPSATSSSIIRGSKTSAMRRSGPWEIREVTFAG